MSIGDRLRRARKDAGLTQKQVAEKAGWITDSNSRLSQYENNKREPTLADIAKIAKITGADPAELAFGGHAELTAEEIAILQSYRNASQEGRRFILGACESAKGNRARKRKESD